MHAAGFKVCRVCERIRLIEFRQRKAAQPKGVDPAMIAEASKPCAAPLCSAERLKVMRERAALGLSLFHAGDNQEHEGVPVPSELCTTARQTRLPRIVRMARRGRNADRTCEQEVASE